MALIRADRPVDNYTQISNAMLKDQRISSRAKGILALMLSFPPGWKTSSERLTAMVPEGRDAVRAALRELEQFGYLQRIKTRTAQGTWEHDQMVSDTPTTPPGPENPATDNQ